MQNAKATKLLKSGATLLLTLGAQGASYSIDGHGTVSLKYARAVTGETLVQSDLFLTPNEDGLFPGFSQTWKA